MRNLIDLTDEQIEEIFDDICTVDELTFTTQPTNEILAGRQNWNEKGRLDSDDEVEGRRRVVILKAQAQKGGRREDITIIDFGAVRAIAAF